MAHESDAEVCVRLAARKHVDDQIAWRAAELMALGAVTPDTMRLVLLRNGGTGIAYRDLRDGRLYLEECDDTGELVRRFVEPDGKSLSEPRAVTEVAS